MIDLSRDGDVHILRLDDGENRFTSGLLDEMRRSSTSCRGAEGPRALVTAGTGKFYSNGLDLEWLSANAAEAQPYLDRVHGLFARFLTLGMPTVAAMNGHTFAAGAMLALCHDHRVMRADRGYFCLPEVDLGLPFTPGMTALLQARLPVVTAHEAMVTGRRYGGEDARTAGIVHETASESEVLTAAVTVAASLAPKAGRAISKIRKGMYAGVLDALT